MCALKSTLQSSSELRGSWEEAGQKVVLGVVVVAIHGAVEQQLAPRRGGVPDAIVGLPQEPFQVMIRRLVDARLKV